MALSILIVEDSKPYQLIVKTFCTSIGAECDIAENGEIGMLMCKKKDYSIYIVDLMMPGMNGKEFIEELHKLYPEPIIIVQTAEDTSQSVIDIMKLGVFDYLIKPLDANRFKMALKRAIDFEKLKRDEKKRIARFHGELSKVREIQASFQPMFHSISGFDIASSILPAEELSGDFLDGYFIDDGLYQIILCDVSGHGIASAYIGVEIRCAFRIFSQEKLSPSDLIDRTNRHLINEKNKANFFATVLVCQIDLMTSTITLSSAGHPPAFHYDSVSGETTGIICRGTLMGFTTEKIYSDVRIDIKKGDALLLYSDGITEALSEDSSSMYDEVRLKNTIKENVNGSSLELVHSIVESVYTFSNYNVLEDDMTLLSIKKI